METLYKKFRFDGYYFGRAIASMLYPYLGPSTYSNDYTPIVIAIAKQALLTTTDFLKEEIYGKFFEYGINEESAEEIVLGVLYDIQRTFRAALGNRLGVNIFDVYLQEGNLIVEDCGVAPYTLDGDYREFDLDLQASVENGDYIPPRLRS